MSQICHSQLRRSFHRDRPLHLHYKIDHILAAIAAGLADQPQQGQPQHLLPLLSGASAGGLSQGFGSNLQAQQAPPMHAGLQSQGLQSQGLQSQGLQSQGLQGQGGLQIGAALPASSMAFDPYAQQQPPQPQPQQQPPPPPPPQGSGAPSLQQPGLELRRAGLSVASQQGLPPYAGMRLVPLTRAQLQSQICF